MKSADRPRPSHLGPEYAAQFEDESVVASYAQRAPYPPEVFGLLLDLVQAEPRNVVDLGCGRGEIARALAPHVGRVDAIDPSAAMLTAGKSLPGGTHPNLNWILGKAEAATWATPCALAVAGNSLHWMEWTELLPRLDRTLMPRAHLAIVESGRGPAPWDVPLGELIRAYSTNRQFRPYDIVSELTGRGLFAIAGRYETLPLAYQRTVEEFVESMHAQNGFSRERMDMKAAALFDRKVRELVTPFVEQGSLQLTSTARITWGRPAS
jgi:ubiquinone/menaquinone biosynthesis C-methylase UbiE